MLKVSNGSPSIHAPSMVLIPPHLGHPGGGFPYPSHSSHPPLILSPRVGHHRRRHSISERGPSPGISYCSRSSSLVSHKPGNASHQSPESCRGLEYQNPESTEEDQESPAGALQSDPSLDLCSTIERHIEAQSSQAESEDDHEYSNLFRTHFLASLPFDGRVMITWGGASGRGLSPEVRSCRSVHLATFFIEKIHVEALNPGRCPLIPETPTDS